MQYKTPLELIGGSPIVKLDGLVGNTIILAKFELYNLTGSAKDKMALGMLRDAEKSGTLKPGGTIIEATTGNAGIAFSALAAICKISRKSGERFLTILCERGERYLSVE